MFSPVFSLRNIDARAFERIALFHLRKSSQVRYQHRAEGIVLVRDVQLPVEERVLGVCSGDAAAAQHVKTAIG